MHILITSLSITENPKLPVFAVPVGLAPKKAYISPTLTFFFLYLKLQYHSRVILGDQGDIG
jgi:hypothetical protein